MNQHFLRNIMKKVRSKNLNHIFIEEKQKDCQFGKINYHYGTERKTGFSRYITFIVVNNFGFYMTYFFQYAGKILQQ